VHPISTKTAVALFSGAVGIRLLAVPTWSRLAFEGHEALYLAAFEGAEVPASTQAIPLLTFLYKWVGVLTTDSRALILLSALAGGAAVVGAAVWIGRWVSPTAGLWTGVLVALLPEHAAWSTSAYNVILPHALLIWAFALGGWRAFVLIGLAASLRIELGLIAVALGWPAVGGLAGLFWGLETPPISDPSLAFLLNLPMVAYLGPPVLLLGVVGLRDRRTWSLLAIALWVHLVGAAFDDYGARHGLLGGVALCGIVAATATWSRTVLPVTVAAGLIWGLRDLHTTWNADESEVGAPLEAVASDLPALPSACVQVVDEPPLQGQAQRSHFAYFSGGITADCVVWGEEFWHRRWNSRSLHDRALRMRVLYRMTPIAAVRPSGGGPVRIYHRLEGRW